MVLSENVLFFLKWGGGGVVVVLLQLNIYYFNDLFYFDLQFYFKDFKVLQDEVFIYRICIIFISRNVKSLEKGNGYL